MNKLSLETQMFMRRCDDIIESSNFTLKDILDYLGLPETIEANSAFIDVNEHQYTTLMELHQFVMLFC